MDVSFIKWMDRAVQARLTFSKGVRTTNDALKALDIMSH